MKKKELILSIIKRIEEMLTQKKKISVNHVADISGFSKRYIQKTFKEETKLTISEYIRKRRLTQAAILIKLTQKSLHHIAMDLQFTTQQSFTRSFCQEFKMSPLQFRKMDYLDCSKFTQNYSLKLKSYSIRKLSLNNIKLNVKSIFFKESLLGANSKRGNIFRHREIDKILQYKPEVIIVTTIEPSSKSNNEVYLNAQIGFEDVVNHNSEVPRMSCWEIDFTGTWHDYISFGRFFIFEVEIYIRKFIMEIITVDNDKKNIYNAKIYIPF
ncbi:helix-turn-helix transcriptional regulator [Escherichia coli]|uniref:helix-turn-helix transcriptional regulator n=1 Tax=Escherichia coli TaxID=562 RepID=UPI001ABC0D3B|nr:helix-turn-helix transcriptional regulator [Escherichia coli]MBS9069757.1 helix-turn-helix transcriptional regulator [Escherichia coli]